MIIRSVDHGWGAGWPIKRIEQGIVAQYLAPLTSADQRVVLINSTWYTQEHHKAVMNWLRNNHWDVTVLISMLDASIPDATWFSEFDRDVLTVGAYPGTHHISLWAEVVASHIQPFAEHDIDLAFMCMNRKPHWHRRRLYEEMSVAGLLDKGLVSMGADDHDTAQRRFPEHLIHNDMAPNGSVQCHGIPNDITSLGDLANWRRHFLNVVTETVFDVDAKYFVSEKIFKPMIGSRPFLVYAEGGAEKWLRDQGFETYLDDFVDIFDLDLRCASNMVPFLTVLSQQGQRYWQHKYLDLVPKIQYNTERFYQFIAAQRQRIQQGILCQI